MSHGQALFPYPANDSTININQCVPTSYQVAVCSVLCSVLSRLSHLWLVRGANWKPFRLAFVRKKKGIER